MLRMGYACQNLSIPATTTHTLRLASVREPERVRQVADVNLAELGAILEWNAAHEIRVFRIGSHLIPFASHPSFPYDWREVHGPRLRELGSRARELGQRLSMHPGQYINPGSLNDGTVAASLAELRYAAGVLTLLVAESGTIVLHLGGAYDDKRAAVPRFVAALRGEREILRFLAIENDEKVWTVPEVAEAAAALGVPVIVDTLHHALKPGGVTLREALDLAMPTWTGRGARATSVVPKLHISTQARGRPAGAHAKGVSRRDWEALVAALDGREADVMLEAKDKDKALLKLRRELGKACCL